MLRKIALLVATAVVLALSYSIDSAHAARALRSIDGEVDTSHSIDGSRAIDRKPHGFEGHHDRRHPRPRPHNNRDGSDHDDIDDYDDGSSSGREQPGKWGRPHHRPPHSEDGSWGDDDGLWPDNKPHRNEFGRAFGRDGFHRPGKVRPFPIDSSEDGSGSLDQHGPRPPHREDGDFSFDGSSEWGHGFEDDHEDASASGAGRHKGRRPRHARRPRLTSTEGEDPDDLVDYPGNSSGF